MVHVWTNTLPAVNVAGIDTERTAPAPVLPLHAALPQNEHDDGPLMELRDNAALAEAATTTGPEQVTAPNDKLPPL